MPRNSDRIRRKRPRGRNRKMICATWNVQGLTNKTEDVIKGLNQIKADIAVLTETKKKGNGIDYLSNYIHIYSGVPKNKRAAKGVSILIHKQYQKGLSSWDTIDERQITANLTIKGHRITILGIYGPNDDALQTEKDEFYDELNGTINKIGNQREIIMLGDFNARVGSSENSQTIGRYGEEVLNNNGQRLREICEQHRLRILNGFFKHRDIHKYTWHQDTRELKSIIDFIITRQCSILNVQDTRVYRGLECGSDHYLVVAKIYVPFNNLKTQNTYDETEEQKLKQMKYNTKGLQDYSTKLLYQNRLNQKLCDDYLTSETNNLYQHIINSLHSAAQEALGKAKYINQNKNNNITWDIQLENQRNKKQEAYKSWLNTRNPEHRQSYKREQAVFKRMIRANKNTTWEAKCREIDSYIGGSRSSEAWKLIKSLRTNTSNKTKIQPITINTWKEHYTKELKEDREQYMTTSPEQFRIQGEYINIDMKMIEQALRTMKNNKACGPEYIPAELLKNGTPKLINFLKELFTRYINGEEIPLSWKEAWITPIHKKGPRDQCGNYRCISVTSTFSRLYGKILKIIIQEEYEPHEIEEQAGFRAGRSCVDHIFTVTQLNEKKVARNREIHLLFVDLTKAYDTVPIKKLWHVLERSPINNTAIAAVKQLYKQAKSKVKVGNNFSEEFLITKGLRQGCCLSPLLFKIYINEALKQWRRSCSEMGVPLNEETTLYTLHFADDQIVIAQDKEDLEFMTRRLFKEYEKWGLSINRTKTQYLCIGNEGSNLTVDENDVIKACEEYTYLGTKINRSGRTESEIEQRIIKGKQVIGCLNSILWSKNISLQRKHLLFNSIFNSIVLYGCETWQLNKSLERRLLALEMDFWRRAAGKSRLEKIPNNQIRQTMGVQTTIIEEIERRQLTWYGHVERMTEGRLPKQILNWVPTARRKRGRPKPSWIVGIQKAMSERNLHPGDWNDRRSWKMGTGRRKTL